jgi:hypothetical protein
MDEPVVTDTTSEWVIRGGRWKAGLAGFGLTLAALLMLQGLEQQPNATHVAISVAASASFGAMGLVALMAFLRPPRLILTAEALVHVHPYGAPRRIDWRDIERFETFSGDYATHRSAPAVVMYKLRPGVAAPGPLAPVYRAFVGLDGALVGSWATGPEDLLTLLQDRHRDARLRRQGAARAKRVG